MATEWYYAIDGDRRGPVSSSELKQLAATGAITPDDLVWRDGMPEWPPARKVKGLTFGPAGRAEPKSEERATRLCPFCDEEIYSDAKKCKHCGEFVSAGPPSLTAVIDREDAKRILDIAQTQKYVLYVLLGQFTALVAGVIVPWVGSLILLVWFVLLTLFVFKFCIATYSRGAGMILGIFSLVPFVGLLILVIVNRSAVRTLKSKGFTVGLMGVPESEIQTFTRRNVG